MTPIDYGIVIIFIVSSLISLVRGFVKESISLASWGLAFWISISFSAQLSGILPASIEMPSLRLAIAFAALFILTLIAGGLVSFLVTTLVYRTGLSGTDRALGVVFGMLRGAVIVAVLVLLAGLTPLPGDPWWRESMLLGHFQSFALWLRDMLPSDVAQNFVYS